MKLIKEIFNKDIGLVSKKKDRAYNLRRASRVVLFNNEEKIALLNIRNEGYYKLPGGALEKDETRENAALREIEEETGYKMNILSTLGLIIEYSDDTNLMQISYAYKGTVREQTHISLSENEQKQGVELEWYTIEEALKIMRGLKPDSYHGKFIVNRDLAFLEESLI
ncbi:MAG: NUDIX hydrolase [Sarcina sp.]